jgi:heme A synthase
MAARGEAEREWLALAVASLGAALAGIAVSTVKNPVPWYLTVAIATAMAVFLVAAAVLAAQPLLRKRHPR